MKVVSDEGLSLYMLFLDDYFDKYHFQNSKEVYPEQGIGQLSQSFTDREQMTVMSRKSAAFTSALP